jgi:hypothetical protein
MSDKLYWKIDKLKSWEKNPRAIEKVDFERGKRQLARAKEIIGEYLFEPLLITPEGEVLGDNIRLKALKDLGAEDIWVNIVNPKTEAEKIELALAANDRWASYVEQDLAALLEANKIEIVLEDYKIDLGTPIDLQTLLDRFGPEVKEDEVPEVPEVAVSKLGEIYQLGKHRLMCGDATKLEDVEKLMDGRKADMIFTDPPYNVDYSENRKLMNDNLGGGRLCQIPVRFLRQFNGFQ